ncbi:hypothetical protein [Geobacter sp. AOG2]|uniref:hypothetical protein n=1 Tax=Geobacter sp. AOG2 TaxID=1566347 RepID=UPI001CC495F8|nr:hypothetical protein [Geobacter sp. AOG2]GFE60799.1 hypothetical protein AOG2_13870 [Geobacter sp. AOG2]
MYENYANVIQNIDNLVEFLNKNGITADCSSHLESDYLKAHQFVEEYSVNPCAKKDESGRAALIGLFELYKWVWAVKDCYEFPKLKEHLKLLIQASPKINSTTPMINPVSKKQDDKTNKFIEAIIGMFAVKFGTNVDLDDPIKSSDGNNPDVLFDYGGKRIAIACKTLRGKSEETIIANLRSASKQLKRATCDIGYVLFNAMNILPHEKIKGCIYDNPLSPLQVLSQDVIQIYHDARIKNLAEMVDIFECDKVRPVVLTFVHSVARLNTPFGVSSTSLKCTFAHDFEIPEIDVANDIELLDKVNDFIHNRF